jgi:hypothetical protein
MGEESAKTVAAAGMEQRQEKAADFSPLFPTRRITCFQRTLFSKNNQKPRLWQAGTET